jgi:MYXO-CTERM domain-containing protein
LSDGISAGFEELCEAWDINNNGLITGRGRYFDGADWSERAYLLDTRTNSSVPETTGTLSLLALTLAGLVALRRRI